jgi:hypothetical protein
MQDIPQTFLKKNLTSRALFRFCGNLNDVQKLSPILTKTSVSASKMPIVIQYRTKNIESNKKY